MIFGFHVVCEVDFCCGRNKFFFGKVEKRKIKHLKKRHVDYMMSGA